ncbi:MAG: response regulator [Nocardioides sp.]
MTTESARGPVSRASAGAIRVLIADDQALVRGAMAALLDLEPDLTVVAQVGSGSEVVAAARKSHAQVCLLDIEMPGLDGIAAVAALASELPDCRSLMVTTFGRPGYLRRAMDAGARGFVVKDTPAPELADAVRRVHAGLRVVDPEMARESLFGGPNPLTPREREVLSAAADGASVASIAATIGLSPGTVRNYLSSTIGKLRADTRVEAARIARERGWL